jgi:CheY-like chemotaxis protein
VSPKKILVVDDDKVLLKMLTKSLTNAGYTVAQVANGKDAVSICKDWRPDLIILDIMMPGMDGMEAARLINSNQVTQGIPIIFLSSLVSKQEEKRSAPKWGSSYMAKPYSQEELLQEISKYI